MSQSEQATTPSPPVPVGSSSPAPAEPARDPFHVFGVIGFVLSFFAIVNIAGLVISIIALIRSKRAGFRNRFAMAGIVISAIGVVITIVVTTFAVSTLVGAAQTCARLGDGVHTIGSSTYTCTPTSFYVSTASTASPSPVVSEEWATANSLYSEAVCPTNAARVELAEATAANDIAQLAPVAASASSSFDAAADVFLDHAWPADIEHDIRFLGETSALLSESWGEVAESTDMDSASAVSFPDAQPPFEAAQRIRAALTQHGQEPPGC
ncbi:MAG TPA: DUF4190 domain-containing protein [Microbacterium sp.]|uniref:DUF4190 domain-containing protein n=1 Tax=Microbacterium sp. TaxID=51671 RepID=UPI002F94D5B2